MEIRKVGVVGCGLMGSGIVETCARAGYDVTVREINQEFLNGGLARIQKSMGRAVDKGKMPAEERDAAWARIHGTTDIKDLAGCDLVIEAAIENMDLKKQIFAELDGLLAPHAILASNTSSLCVTEMASVTKRGDKMLGMHFFNPVPVMPLLEFVRTILTSDETMTTAREFGASLGKTMVTAKDTPGFIVNLLLIPYILDAVRMVENDLATKEDIDTAIKLGLNHPMGPLTLLDFVGLDTTLFIADAMFDEFKDPKFAAPPLLRRMVLAGYLGRKSGRGFYDYGK
ncbi:MAG: 3-hydroxybutyryl-CoA dehydrogenase [Chloroflexi bacterium]|nr:3-hydroxybutyryl-CoA dehydrogenase [Chloroflexota bacterium]MBU1749987.1 3-hydroxybutyryl-CoA dehydrogenase [Chloroflexota bacterium]